MPRVEQGWAAAVNAAFPVSPAGQYYPAYGGMYLSASAETTVAGADTPVKAAGTTLALPGARGFSMISNNRLRYTDTETATFAVTAAFSVQAADANQTFNFMVAVGSVPDATSEITRKIVVAAEEGAGSLSTLMEVASQEFLEFWIENTTSGGNATITKLLLTAVKVS